MYKTSRKIAKIKNTKIVNDPKAIRDISEKLYSTEFNNYMPKTLF